MLSRFQFFIVLVRRPSPWLNPFRDSAIPNRELIQTLRMSSKNPLASVLEVVRRNSRLKNFPKYSTCPSTHIHEANVC